METVREKEKELLPYNIQTGYELGGFDFSPPLDTFVEFKSDLKTKVSDRLKIAEAIHVLQSIDWLTERMAEGSLLDVEQRSWVNADWL